MSVTSQSASSDVSLLHEWGEENRRRSNRMRSIKADTVRGGKMLKLHSYAKRTLGTGNIEDAVLLPEGEDLNEWLAMHIVDFFNEITLLYEIVAELDTEEKFPVMGAGKHKYLWADNTTVEPLKLSAPAYVQRLFEWIENQLNDESIFPTELDQPFPSNFKARVSRIFRRLFRVYAHIYYSHFEYIVAQSAEAHMNSCFKHFVLFSRAFGLVGEKEMEPLRFVIGQLVGTSGPDDRNAEAYENAAGDDDDAASVSRAICRDRDPSSVSVSSSSLPSSSSAASEASVNSAPSATAAAPKDVQLSEASQPGETPQAEPDKESCCVIL